MGLLIYMSLLPLLSVIATVVDKNASFIKVVVPIICWAQVILLTYLFFPALTSKEILIFSGDFCVDSIAAYFILLTNCVAAFSFTHCAVFFNRELLIGKIQIPLHERIYYATATLFVLAMSYVFTCDNLGYLWICVEATTLFSASLVYFSRDRHALEATWKYLIVCSLGIAFALVGTILIFASSQQGILHQSSLNIGVLVKNAANLQPRLLQIGYLFCLLGYGTKAGIFPLHGWLPDAHSEAPAPASALLSGALLNCALFAICRITDIVKLSSHHHLAFVLPIVWGTITAVIAALFLIHQSGIKRLWAYSSIENVGIMLVAIGLGSHSLFLIQAINHSIAKVSLFLLSGNIIQECGTKNLSQIRGVLKSSPLLGVLFAFSAAAVTGSPPFGTFIGEWLLLAKSADAHIWWVTISLLLALSMSFVAVSIHVGKILMGTPKSSYVRFNFSGNVIPAILCVCALILGVTSLPLIWVNAL